MVEGGDTFTKGANLGYFARQVKSRQLVECLGKGMESDPVESDPESHLNGTSVDVISNSWWLFVECLGLIHY